MIKRNFSGQESVEESKASEGVQNVSLDSLFMSFALKGRGWMWKALKEHMVFREDRVLEYKG